MSRRQLSRKYNYLKEKLKYKILEVKTFTPDPSQNSQSKNIFLTFHNALYGVLVDVKQAENI